MSSIIKTNENVKTEAVSMVMQQRLQSNNNSSILRSDIPVAKPFVKWAGGKTQLLEMLVSFMPTRFNGYFEPFLGGGALFFHITTERKNRPLTASYYYISDINSELINAYSVIKDNPEELISLLEQHQIEYNKRPEEYYYRLRNMNLKKADGITRAARFITLNKTCFDGLLYRNTNFP